MNKRNAAGRKTENKFAGQLASHLDQQLALLTEALGQCLTEANSIPRQQDEYGHHRAGEITHAMAIARTSAKLVTSLAKITSEFRHDIVVSHIGKTEPSMRSGPLRVRRIPVRNPFPEGSYSAAGRDESLDQGVPPSNSEGSNG